MTEVPDKLTEGTGRGRGRGTGRGRGRTGDAEREPVAASGRPSRAGDPQPAGRAGAASRSPPSRRSALGLVALPGEKLSKAAIARLEAAAVPTADDRQPRTRPSVEFDDAGRSRREGPATRPRRRRRRGGRGRGRGRGRAETGELEATPAGDRGRRWPTSTMRTKRRSPTARRVDAPRGPRPGAFGSVWDSQIGQTRTPSGRVDPVRSRTRDEDEPAIPEYLIAEQRRGSVRQPWWRSVRPVAAAEVAAITPRSTVSAMGAAAVAAASTAIRTSRAGAAAVAAVGGRPARDGRRDDRGPGAADPDRDRVPSGRSDEPWSEVPPELEAMLRAQLAKRTEDRPIESAVDPGAETIAERRRAERGPATRKPAAKADPVESTEVPASEADAAAPKRRTSTRKPAAKAGHDVDASRRPSEADAAAPKRRTSTRKPAAKAAATSSESPAAEADAAAPKRRTIDPEEGRSGVGRSRPTADGSTVVARDVRVGARGPAPALAGSPAASRWRWPPSPG